MSIRGAPFTRACAGLGLAATLLVSPLRAQTPVWSFVPGSLSEHQLVAEFQGAVAYIEVKDPLVAGTGFLILKDDSGGYIITAGHVVQSAVQDPTKHIQVRFPQGLGLEFPATVVKCVTQNATDFALLHVTNPVPGAADPAAVPPLSRLRPVDISLMPPDGGDSIYAMGYPKISPLDAVLFREQPVSFTAVTPDGSFEVRQATFPGNSGGPLLDATGSARGVCREEVGVGATIARYLPLSQVALMLRDLPLTPRIRELDARLRAGTVVRDDLILTLKATSQTPTNMELFLWALAIKAHRADYSQSVGLIHDVVIPALIQRGLPDQGLDLAWAASPEQIGTASLAMAQRAQTLGQTLTALSLAREAFTAFRTAGDESKVAKAGLLVASINLDVDNITAAAEPIREVLQKTDLLPDWQKAEVYQLEARINHRKNELEASASLYPNATYDYVVDTNYYKSAAELNASASNDWHQGKLDAAAESFRKAAILYDMSDNRRGKSDSLFKLSWVLDSAGRKAEASKTLKDFVKLFPEDPRATDALAYLNTPTDGL